MFFLIKVPTDTTQKEEWASSMQVIMIILAKGPAEKIFFDRRQKACSMQDAFSFIFNFDFPILYPLALKTLVERLFQFFSFVGVSDTD